MLEKFFFNDGGISLCYYEVYNNKKPLILIHGQGVDALHFKEVFKSLSKRFHVYAIDCYGHGESLHDKSKYTLSDIGDAIIKFIRSEVDDNIRLLGHSTGGLIAAYVAAKTNFCEKLILEEVPFFNIKGEAKKKTFNYRDLFTVCHKFVSKPSKENFPIFYFKNQYSWNFMPKDFPEESKDKLIAKAEKFFEKHPDKDLKLSQWPKEALYAFEGIGKFDPYFGEALYNDSFHGDIDYESLLKDIWCETLFLKANYNVDDDGVFLGAIDDDGLEKLSKLIKSFSVVGFDCGHSIHKEMPKEFAKYIIKADMAWEEYY